MLKIVTALALVLVIEGVLYALFPSAMKRMMSQVMQFPDGALRQAGLLAVLAGVAIVWFTQL